MGNLREPGGVGGTRTKAVEGRPLDDAGLVERAKEGEVGAYEELVRRYQGIAHRVAYLITRSAAEAEDAVQEAFVKAFYSLARFRGGSSFRPWLLRIVANEARNRRRSAWRRQRLALRASWARAAGDAVPSPEALALAGWEGERLLEAVNALREKDRMVIAYRYFLQLSEAEMAELMACARGTVKSRLARALARLRAEFDRLGGSDG
jgi:RNA polymerase sigma factor (sigma-70 family)